MLLKMAWKNIGRQRGRSYLSILAIMVGVFVVIATKGFMDGTIDSTINQNINLNSGHIRMINPDYEKKESLLSLNYPIGMGNATYSQIIREFRQIPGVTMVTGRIRFGIMLVSGDKHETVLGIGANLAEENRVNQIGRYLEGKGSGAFPKSGRQEILLGEGLLKKFQLKTGDKVNAVLNTSFGSLKIATFQISGAMASGMKYLDEGVAYIPLDTAMTLLELDDAVTEIVVFGKSLNQTARLKSDLEKYAKIGDWGVKIIPWDKYNEIVISLTQSRAIYNIIYVFIIVLASFVVFNTLMMIVAERTRQIGMFSALGFTQKEIRNMFLMEGFIMAVLGCILGTALGGLAVYSLSISGIDMSQMMQGADQAYLMTPKIYPSFNFGTLFFGFGLGLVVTLLTTYLPARKASMLKPVEALRVL